jgi:hypothetical protein
MTRFDLSMPLAAFIVLLLATAAVEAQTPPPDAPPPPDQAHQHREPPPQAYDACQGKKVGDAVQFQGRRGMMDATCTDSPKGLFARPNRPPPGAPPPPQ